MRSLSLACMLLLPALRLSAVAQIRNVWAEPAFFCPGSGQAVTVHFEASRATAGLMALGLLSQDSSIQLAGDYAYMYDSFTGGTGACPAAPLNPIDTWRSMVTLYSGSNTTFLPYTQTFCLPAAMSGWSTVHVLIRLADAWSGNASSTGDLTYDLAVPVSCSKRMTTNSANFWYAHTNSVDVVIDNSCASTPTRTPSPLISPSPTRTATATVTRTSTLSPSPSPSSTFTLSATPTITRTPMSTYSATPSFTLTLSSTPSLTPSATPSATLTRSPTSTVTSTSSVTPTLTATSSITPGPSPTYTATKSFTPTVTSTPSDTLTSTGTPSQTYTLSSTPSRTLTATPSFSPTLTSSSTLTPTPTFTPSFSDSPTLSPGPSSTYTATRSSTPTPSLTSTITVTLTQSPSQTESSTSTPSSTLSSTQSPGPSATSSATRTLSATPSSTSTQTLTPTPSASMTASPTESSSRTATLSRTPTPTSSASSTRTPTPVPAPFHIEIAAYNSAGERVALIYAGGIESQPLSLGLATSSAVQGSSLVFQFSGRLQEGGSSLSWNLSNDAGQMLSAGFYLIKAEVKDAFGSVQSLSQDIQILAAAQPSCLRIFNSAGERVWQSCGASWAELALEQNSFVEGESLKIRGRDLNGAALSQSWDGKNERGDYVSPGGYSLVIELGQGRAVTKSFSVLRAPEASALDGAQLVGSPWRGSGAIELRLKAPLPSPMALRLYALDGALVGAWGFSPGATRCAFEPGRLASGIYVAACEIQGGARQRATLRLAVLR